MENEELDIRSLKNNTPSTDEASGIDIRDLYKSSSDKNTYNYGSRGDVNLYNYDPSKYDKGGIQVNELPFVESIRESNQDILDSLGRSTANLVGKTGINIIGGIAGSIYGLGSAIANGEVSKIWDNSLTTVLDKASEEVGDYFKVYKSADFESMNMLAKAVLHPIQFTDEVMDTLSFTTGAILTELITAGMASGVVVPRALKYLKALDTSADAAKVAGNLGSASNRILNTLGDAGTLTRQLATGAAWEASVEARQASIQLRDKMYADWLNDNPGNEEIPQDIKSDIDERVSNAGLFTFLTNMALVGGSNMLQFPKIFGSGYNTSKRAVDANRIKLNAEGIYEDVLSNLTRSEKALRDVTTFLKNPFMEGIVEEGGQAVLSNTAGMYWDRKNDDNSKSNVGQFLNAFSKSLADTYTTGEGWNEIGMGMLIGSIGAPGRGVVSVLGRNNKIGATGFNEDGTRKEIWTGGIAGSFQERNKEDSEIAELVDKLNENSSLSNAMKANYDFLVKTDSIQKNMDAALSENDVFAFENFKDDQLHSYITSRIDAGLTDDLDTTVEQLSKLSNEDFFTSFRGTETSENTSDIDKASFKQRSLESLRIRIDNVRSAVDIVNGQYQGNNEDLREELIYNVASAKNTDIRENNINNQLSKLSGGRLYNITKTGMINDVALRGLTATTIPDYIKRLQKTISDDKTSSEEKAGLKLSLEYLKNIPNKFKNLTVEELDLLSNFIQSGPVDAKLNLDKILTLLDDSRKLRIRRQSFIDIYNSLFTKEGQEAFEAHQKSIIEEREKEEAKKVANEARQAEEQVVKDRQNEIKEKAAQVKKTEIAQEPISDELNFTEATYVPEDNISIEEKPLFEGVLANMSKAQLGEYFYNKFPNYFSDPTQASNNLNILLNDNLSNELQLTEEELSAIRGFPIQTTNEPLTKEENVVLELLENDLKASDNNIEKLDGLIINGTDVDIFKESLVLVDDTRKRAVGNTIISLNVEYAENILGSVGRNINAYNIYDNYDDNGNLIINSNFDSRLQDPNQFKPGDKVRMIVPTHQQMVDYGRVDYSISTHADESSNVESLPIAFIDSNDKIIGFLPTTDNVRRRVQAEYLDNAIRENVNLRQDIFENQSAIYEVTITSKTTGAPLFNLNPQPIYTSLGNGERLSEGVKIAVYKQGMLRIGLNTGVTDNIKLPQGITPEQYFEEGVIYSVIPTATEDEYFAIPMDINTIGEDNARSIIKMIQLFRQNSLESEREVLSNEVDFSNIQQLIETINNIIYINNKNDKYMFDIDLNNGKLNLGLSSDLTFDLNDIVNDKSVQNKIVNILSKRFYAVRLANFGDTFTKFNLNTDTNQLEAINYSDYNDYLNDNSVITSNLQATAIEGTDKQYFTAQSVIEFSNPISLSTKPDIQESEEVRSVQIGEAVVNTPKRKSRLKPKIRPKGNNLSNIEEDLNDLGDLTNTSLDEQAEKLMRRCE